MKVFYLLVNFFVWLKRCIYIYITKTVVLQCMAGQLSISLGRRLCAELCFLSDYFRFKDTLRGFWPLIVRWSNVLTFWFPLCLFYACTQRCHTHSSACFMLLCWKNMPWNHNISDQDKEEASINGITCMLNCNAKCIDPFFW